MSDDPADRVAAQIADLRETYRLLGNPRGDDPVGFVAWVADAIAAAPPRRAPAAPPRAVRPDPRIKEGL